MRKRILIYQVDAFTSVPLAGNPAGVVLDADDLPPDLRQRIAREMNCSETAFVASERNGVYHVRYYTPQTEVDLCGHATIGALHALHEQRGVVGDVVIDTNVGSLPARIEHDGQVWMRQASPAFRDVDAQSQKEMLDALGVRETDVPKNLPLALAYTGLWDIMVPVSTRQILLDLAPNMAVLEAVSRRFGAASVHVYTFDTVEPSSTLHARDFSPAVGVPEDPHTGTASGALAALLVHSGIVQPSNYVFEQGWSVRRPGLIHVQVDDAMQVSVGGRATTVITGDMVID